MPHHTHASDEAHDRDEPEAGRVREAVESDIDARDDWACRRRKGIPTDKQLLVVACMDERIPVEDVLGLSLGDAQIFRNAGGKVTDDVIRSAALTTQFFDTTEIIVLNHTDCGMMSASDEAIVDGFQAAVNGDLSDLTLDPSLPELNIGAASIEEWVRMTDDVDVACAAQVEYLENHDLIPENVTVSGYVYEVESGHLRRPGERLAERVNERA
ncbi:beta-class carbonic anhydrase [Haloarcula salina]|uniref:Carbonic anhydrase n=1 Tax=Haloarcula salina TaxID=1429914 RepID=A0AA41G404_9EURY|nr:carbonic anhydrase [Haloarcula salina]MBV0903229.1 carbonic anhydrase [Haloarcula salina]